MKQKRKSLRKDKRGFTGLEAAIVLTAFIVVAAVFSYVVLNAGFFTSEKAKAVVHTGVEQVTSSCALAGNVIGHGWQYSTTAGNQTLGSRELGACGSGGSNESQSGATLISPGNNTLYVVVQDVNWTCNTTAGYLNVSVTYKNATGTSNTTGWFDFTANGTQSTTLDINVTEVTYLNVTYNNVSNNGTGANILVLANGGTGGTYYPNGDNELDSTNLTVAKLYLTLTAGQHPIDMDRLTVAYTDRDTHVGELNYIADAGNVAKGDLPMQYWTYTTADTPGATDNNMLEPGEETIVLITLPNYGVTAGKPFTIELKPTVGAVVELTRNAPGQIDKTMTLY